jgi:ribosomal protein L7/L12
MAALDEDAGRRLAELVKAGRTLEALKLVREVTGCGLKEAKDAVDQLARGEALRAAPAKPGGGSADEVLAEAVRQLLRRGAKLEAVKLYRERKGCGLKEAMDAVEKIAAEGK